MVSVVVVVSFQKGTILQRYQWKRLEDLIWFAQNWKELILTKLSGIQNWNAPFKLIITNGHLSGRPVVCIESVAWLYTIWIHHLDTALEVCYSHLLGTIEKEIESLLQLKSKSKVGDRRQLNGLTIAPSVYHNHQFIIGG